MQDWEILDRDGFAGLRLGEERQSVRARLGACATFRRTPEAMETDHFSELGLMVTYTPEDRVSYIEVTSPATPRLVGVPLLGRPLDAVVRELAQAGLCVVSLDPDDVLVEQWGVALYSPYGTVEGVGVGE